MSNIRNHGKFSYYDSQIWKRSKIDKKGQTTLPRKLRLKLGVNNKEAIVLWVSAKRKKNKEGKFIDNEFLLEVGVKQ